MSCVSLIDLFQVLMQVFNQSFIMKRNLLIHFVAIVSEANVCLSAGNEVH